MKILIACEESQRVCSEFRKKGHEAYSCDILEQSGGHPEWHIRADVLPLINGNCAFLTSDGKLHELEGKWDMIIAFPPCTDLCNSGARWFADKRQSGVQRKSIEFFCQFLFADCDRISIENPVGIIGGSYVLQYFPDLCDKYDLPRKPTQKIQPYYFGDKARKTTCLWLKNLPELVPTEMVEPGEIMPGGYSCGASAHYARGKDGKILSWNDPLTAIIRSKTFLGVAKAMAEQWG